MKSNKKKSNVGDNISNLELSAKRAQEVHDYLISLGVDANRLSFKGFGEDVFDKFDF